ncbi:MAG TPA: MBL fold metallo-hydrolase [Gammaproteobacteria bacterium]|nr:MBL fold metallo-hydrolase [Gammaproteobacteria bacterium]
MLLSRRSLLQTVVGSVAGLSLGLVSRSLVAQAPAGAVDLGGGFRVLTAGKTNVLAVTGPEGTALVDGGSAADSPALLRQVAALPNAGKIHTLFNTHWHPEQVGSNEALAKAGAAIVAHENTRLWLTEDVTWPWNDQTVKALPKAAQPTKTFRAEEELTVGGMKVRCGHLRDCPHTDGDIYVLFPEANVLAIGDAVYGKGAGWPDVDWWTGGWIGGIVGAIDMLFTVSNAETRIVPARGPVMTQADLKAAYQMYGAVWERLVKTLYAGGGPKEALAAAPTKEFNDIMGSSDEFVRRAFESLWAYLSPDA